MTDLNSAITSVAADKPKKTRAAAATPAAGPDTKPITATEQKALDRAAKAAAKEVFRAAREAHAKTEADLKALNKSAGGAATMLANGEKRILDANAAIEAAKAELAAAKGALSALKEANKQHLAARLQGVKAEEVAAKVLASAKKKVDAFN